MPQLRSSRDQAPTPSGVSHRYRHLHTAHNSLERSLTGELRRPLPDASAIQRLKRRKLLIKDELAAIERLFAAIGTSGDEVISRPGNGCGPKAEPSAKIGRNAGDLRIAPTAKPQADTATH